MNRELAKWDDYYKTTYGLVLEKKASLFVIYNGKKAINISLNLINDKILFSCISCYDIDYSAFNLGSTDLFKHVEWCIKNNFDIIDLLKGTQDYKKRWADTEYFFQKQFVYDSRSISAFLKTKLDIFNLVVFYKFFNLLKKMNLHLFYRKYKFKKSKSFEVTNNKPEINVHKFPYLINLKDWNKICLEENKPSFEKKRLI